MANEGPEISVVIPTIHRPLLLARCLETILAGDFPDFEVVIVDQSTDDESRRVVSERFGRDSRVRYVHSAVTGAARARNLGLAESRGEVVVFLDDDVVSVSGLLRAYSTAFRMGGPAVGLVGGRILPDWDVAFPSWYPRELAFILGLYDIGMAPRDYPAGDTPPSANFAVRRAVAERLGGFDARLGYDAGRPNPLLAGEDVHFARKALGSGHAIRYEPGAEVHHRIGAYKLTPHFLLRRSYWEGRTFATLRRYGRAEGNNRSWIEMWKDSRRKRRKIAAGPRVPAQALRSRVMLSAALVAFAAGIVMEAASRLVGRTGDLGPT